MKKASLITLLLLIAVIASTAFIFSNSLKDQATSAADSEGIVKLVEQVAKKVYPENRVNWTVVVRKGAHLFEFFLLGLCSLSFAFRIKTKRWKQLGGTFLYSLLIASSDEFIQRFTGRGASVGDVMIDFIGASLGISFLWLICFILRRRRKNP